MDNKEKRQALAIQIDKEIRGLEDNFIAGKFNSSVGKKDFEKIKKRVEKRLEELKRLNRIMIDEM